MPSRKPQRRRGAAAPQAPSDGSNARQLCTQVGRTVEGVLAGELGDAALRDLIVHSVEPAPDDASHEPGAVIRVTDQGVGIAPDELEGVFQPFRGGFARGSGFAEIRIAAGAFEMRFGVAFDLAGLRFTANGVAGIYSDGFVMSVAVSPGR